MNANQIQGNKSIVAAWRLACLSMLIGIVCSTTAHSNNTILEPEPEPGTLKWKFETDDGVYSSPAIGSDGTIYIGSEDGNIYAINPDGSKKWAFLTGDFVESSPAIGSDGTIYVGSGDGNVYAINGDHVEQNASPTAVCQDLNVQLDTGGTGSTTGAAVNNGSSDPENGTNLTLSLNNSSFSCGNLGSNTVTLTVTDTGGLSDTCSATVTVEDPLGACVEQIECACPDIAQSLCDDLYSGAFDNFYLADLSDEMRLRIEAVAPASCPQAEIDQCVADFLAAFGL